ncbi:MAG: metallophosphoesterase family protein [Gammaproteobacteria bacterium]|nr:metallophosphoesterase family protein [Gammaproteobacteria bacterium]
MYLQRLNSLWFLLTASKSKLMIAFRIIILLLLVIAVGRLIQVYSGNFYSGERQPYLQSMSSDSVVIRWQTAEKMRGQLHYGVHPAKLDQLITETSEAEEHQVKLSALSADTQYYYAIGNESRLLWQGPKYRFRTALPAGSEQPVRVWVLGDPGYNSEQHHKVRDSMLNWVEQHPRKNRPAYDLIMTTGDNAYRSGTNQQFQQNFFNLYSDIFTSTVVWPLYGNHDARRWAFFNIFSFPENAEAGGVASHSERYYSFDFGNVHFVMLDSFDGAKDQDDEMLVWLKKDLALNNSRWLVAALHHPPYSKGNQDSDDQSDSRGRLFNSRQNIVPVLEKYGVDLVLSGHSHSYERSHLIDCHYGLASSFNSAMLAAKAETDPLSAIRHYTKSAKTRAHQGAIFAVVGSTAKLNRQGSFDHPAMDVGLAEYGSFVLDIEADTMTGRFINQNGQQRDAFVVKKDSKQETFVSSCQ